MNVTENDEFHEENETESFFFENVAYIMPVVFVFLFLLMLACKCFCAQIQQQTRVNAGTVVPPTSTITPGTVTMTTQTNPAYGNIQSTLTTTNTYGNPQVSGQGNPYNSNDRGVWCMIL